MPVTRPLLSCSPFLSFQSALRASGQSCAQCPWFLDNQPEKSCSPLAHSPHLCAARAALICTTASCICLPLCHSRCSCLFIQRLALRLSWTEKQSRSGRISMHPAGLLGRWVFLAVPASPYFHVGNTNILWVIRFWSCRHIQIDFHTFHFPFLLTFCTCFFPSC